MFIQFVRLFGILKKVLSYTQYRGTHVMLIVINTVTAMFIITRVIYRISLSTGVANHPDYTYGSSIYCNHCPEKEEDISG